MPGVRILKEMNLLSFTRYILCFILHGHFVNYFRVIFLPNVIYILLDCLCILFLWLGSFSKFHRWIFSFTFKLIYSQHHLRLNFRRFPSIRSYNGYSCLCLLISVSSVVLSWISEFLTMWDLNANIARAWKMLTSKTNRAARYGRKIVL